MFLPLRESISRCPARAPARRLVVALMLGCGLCAGPAFAQSAACSADETQVNYDFSAATWGAGDTTDSVTVFTGTSGNITLGTAITGGNHQGGTPYIGTRGGVNNSLNIEVDRSNSTQVNTVTFTFTRAITNLRFVTSDIDYDDNNYRDQITVTGVNALGNASSPVGTATNTGNVTMSSATNARATTSSVCADSSAQCDATWNFSTPVTTVTLVYSNFNVTGNPTQQFIGIHDLDFCVPTVGRVRTSKTTTNVAGGPFSFADAGTVSGTLGALTTVTPGVAVSNAALPIANLANSVTIAETAATGFALASVICTDANSATTGLNASNLATLAGNTATITAANHAPGSDITCAFTNNPQADVVITKSNGVSSLVTGAATSYTIRVTNNGPGSVNAVILGDPAVTGLNKTAVVCSGTPGQCVTAPTIAQLQGGSFALPTLANGQFYEITVTATVTATGL